MEISPENVAYRLPRALVRLKAAASPPKGKGEEDIATGGVLDHGAQEEDGPGTWETLVPPRRESGNAEGR